MMFFDDPHNLVEPFYHINPEEKFDMEDEVARLLREKNEPQWGILIDPMEFYTLDPDKYELALKGESKK